MNKLLALAACFVLAACGSEEPVKIEKPAKKAEVASETAAEKSDFKPITYIDPKAEAVCAKNNGLKGCYGFAFECNDGLKTKVENVSCIDNQYVEDKTEAVPQQTQKSTTESKDPKQTCTKLAALAEKVMELRQNDVPMSKAMSAAGDNPLLTGLVEEAYQRSAFATEEYKQKAIREFGDRAYSSCWKNLNK